jgi:hypothetical protein
MTTKQMVAIGIGGVVVLSARASWAGALGIPLDGFLTSNSRRATNPSNHHDILVAFS